MNPAPTTTALSSGSLLRTVAVFSGALLAFEVAAAMLLGTPAVGWLCEVTASVAGMLARLTGAQVAVSGIRLSTPARELLVNPECTGVFLFALLGALVVASPVTWKTWARGIALGISAIVCANMLRLVLVIHLSGIEGRTFALLHDYLFQAGMLFVVLGVWSAWLSGVGDDASG